MNKHALMDDFTAGLRDNPGPTPRLPPGNASPERGREQCRAKPGGSEEVESEGEEAARPRSLPHLHQGAGEGVGGE